MSISSDDSYSSLCIASLLSIPSSLFYITSYSTVGKERTRSTRNKK